MNGNKLRKHFHLNAHLARVILRGPELPTHPTAGLKKASPMLPTKDLSVEATLTLTSTNDSDSSTHTTNCNQDGVKKLRSVALNLRRNAINYGIMQHPRGLFWFQSRSHIPHAFSFIRDVPSN